MYEQTISHALGLHMHQPPGNLKLLIETNPWEAEQIIRCYERAARYADDYKGVAFLHVGFSGILLEQFLDPRIVDAYRHIIDIPAMLERYRNTPNVELIGMGYYHPIFPLIPQEDWRDQLVRGRQIMQEAFGRAPRGFWPPEMAFTMEMIPALIDAGYDYVVVDSVHVQPEDGIQDIYRPYQACHDGRCITIISRDRDISNAQESGLNPSWFANEIQQKVGNSPRPHEPRLVTTWSDGENGGWFRQTDENSGFFGYFFAPYMEHVRHGEYPSHTVSLSVYLEEHPPQEKAQVQTGAWNVGDTSGMDFAQWAGSESQRKAVDKIVQVSQRYHQLAERSDQSETLSKLLTAARHTLLEAETSCYLFWGDSWIPHLYQRTNLVETLLERAEQVLTVLPSERVSETVKTKADDPVNTPVGKSLRTNTPGPSTVEEKPTPASLPRRKAVDEKRPPKGKKSSSRKKVATKKQSHRKKRKKTPSKQ
ncbi:MAG: polysaccharide deacetylase family protein [Gammaproteobacteria bacterium]|nr:polysaccharide deacetylase family protein [Gammaproteobacteria bacterium]